MTGMKKTSGMKRTGGVSRRKVLQGGAATLAVGAGLMTSIVKSTPARAAGGKVIIGAFADGGLTPFKEKIIPLAKEQGGFDIQFLEDEYGVTLEKWFADAQNSAGQYDLYLLDDPWVPQFGAADVLEDLGAGGIDGNDKDWIGSMIDMGFWPPRAGPRVKGFESATPKLITVPFVGDLQTLTYRNDVYGSAPATWDELIAKGKEAVAAGKIKFPVVFRGVSGNPIVTSWYPVFLSFGGEFFDDKWNPTFNSEAGKASAEFFVGTMRRTPRPAWSSSTAIRKVRRSSAAMRVPSSNTPARAQSRRSKQTKVPGKARLRRGAEAGEGHLADGDLHRRRAEICAEQAELDRLPEVVHLGRRTEGTGHGGVDPGEAQRLCAEKPGNRLIPVALQQLDAGCLPRPRTPDWAKVEELLGIQLNKALQAGSGGGAALDTAAQQVKDYLTQAGYYK